MNPNLNARISRLTLAILLICFANGISGAAQADVCDVDADGDVDREDVKLIVVARDTPAGKPSDVRDANGDGMITILDARACIRQCNLPNCKIIEAGAVAPADDGARESTSKAPVLPESKTDAIKPRVTASATSGAGNKLRVAIGRNEWTVKSGDTLYAISRAFYPGNAGQQARLRQDIMRLNPTVFADGANKMDVGVVLKLPDYVAVKRAPSEVIETAPEIKSIAVETTPSRSAAITPAAKPEVELPEVTSAPAPEVSSVQESTTKTEPTVKTEPAAKVTKENPVTETKTKSVQSQKTKGGFFASLGYSFGGDEVVETDSGLDFTAGTGVHLRLGYEQMANRVSGYRVALGLQYNLTLDDGGDDASLRNSYLQLAYQYRADDLVYGIGAVMLAKTVVENDVGADIDYDPATGVAIYLENVSNGSLAGWGLSYTSIELDEEDSSETADASRVEAYYSWRF